MKLEIGKRYWRRDGKVSEVIGPNDDPDYPFTDGVYTYMADGKWDLSLKPGLDLIAEYHDPASDGRIPHETLARLAAEHGINITATYGDEYYEYGG